MTALWASPATWTLYNGLIAYVMMGLLFAGEYVVRWHFKRQPWYRPTGRGLEIRIREKLEELRRLNAEARAKKT
jgi:hypothetical protein